MSRPEGRPRGSRLARLARWFGFDRNPLRRPSDRMESLLRLAVLILLITAVPMAMMAAGRLTDQLATRSAHSQQAADHQVTAVLLAAAAGTGAPDPYSTVQTTWVMARWELPGLPVRSGEVLAPVGSPAGSTIRIWVDRTGAISDPPADQRDVSAEVTIAVMFTCMASLFLLFGSAALAGQALNRRRLETWDAEWRSIGPRWSGHHT